VTEEQARPNFDQFSQSFSADLYRYLLWLTKDPDTASDVAQETWIRAWRSWDKLRDGKAAKQWVLTIARREFYRILDKRRDHHYNLEDAMLSSPQHFATEENDQVDQVRDALWELEDDYREPLMLQVMMGYSTEEIASAMDLKQGAVLTRLFRARKQLKGVLEKHNPEIGQVGKSEVNAVDNVTPFK